MQQTEARHLSTYSGPRCLSARRRVCRRLRVGRSSSLHPGTGANCTRPLTQTRPTATRTANVSGWTVPTSRQHQQVYQHRRWPHPWHPQRRRPRLSSSNPKAVAEMQQTEARHLSTYSGPRCLSARRRVCRRLRVGRSSSLHPGTGANCTRPLTQTRPTATRTANVSGWTVPTTTQGRDLIPAPVQTQGREAKRHDGTVLLCKGTPLEPFTLPYRTSLSVVKSVSAT